MIYNSYFTDNDISQKVLKATGLPMEHIDYYIMEKEETPVFYGILRGTGVAMRICKALGLDYIYIDNGYFDAVYMDDVGHKELTGKYRVVRNDMVEEYPGSPTTSIKGTCPNILILPPSPYSAFMYDTTPGDWTIKVTAQLKELGHPYKIRKKESKETLEDDLTSCDAIVSFNSMSVMKAVEMGKAVFDEHGIFRNMEVLGAELPYYDMKDLQEFYQPRNKTLEELGSCFA